jgi:septum site-determining protein MinC
MPSVVPAPISPAYEFKSAYLDAVALILKTLVMQDVLTHLQQELNEAPGFFDQSPVIIDLSAFNEVNIESFDLALFVE